MADKMPARGRPTTLDRQHVLNVAMMSYWTDGPTDVSINEICRRAGVSKPGLYREFGNEDGLKQAVISAYASQMLGQLRELLTSDLSFSQTLQALSAPIFENPTAGQPKGCLYVEMCNCTEQLGSMTTAKVEEVTKQSLDLFEIRIDRAKSDNQFKKDIATTTAARYIYEHMNNALSQQKRGVPVKEIAAVLDLALSVFD